MFHISSPNNLFEEDESSYDEESLYSNCLSTIWEETLEDLMRENGIEHRQLAIDVVPFKPQRRFSRRSSFGSTPSDIIQSTEPLNFIMTPEKMKTDWDSTDHTPETVDTSVVSPIPQHMLEDDEFTFVTCSDDNDFLDESIRSQYSHHSNDSSGQQYAAYSYSYKNDLAHCAERRKSFETSRDIFQNINFVPKADLEKAYVASGEQRRESFQKIKDFFHIKKDSIKRWRDHCQEDVIQEAHEQIHRFSGLQRRASFDESKSLLEDEMHNKQTRSSFGGYDRSESFKIKKEAVDKEIKELKKQRGQRAIYEERFGGFERTESFKSKKKLVDSEFRTHKLVIGGKTSKRELEKYGSRRQERYQKTKSLVQRISAFKKSKTRDSTKTREVNRARAEALHRAFEEQREQQQYQGPAFMEPMMMSPRTANRRASTGDISMVASESPGSSGASIYSPTQTLHEKRLKREMARANLKKSFNDLLNSPVVAPKKSRRSSLAECTNMESPDNKTSNVRIETEIRKVDKDINRLIMTLENSPMTMTPRPKLKKAKSNLRRALKGLTLPNFHPTEVVAMSA